MIPLDTSLLIVGHFNQQYERLIKKHGGGVKGFQAVYLKAMNNPAGAEEIAEVRFQRQFFNRRQTYIKNLGDLVQHANILKHHLVQKGVKATPKELQCAQVFLKNIESIVKYSYGKALKNTTDKKVLIVNALLTDFRSIARFTKELRSVEKVAALHPYKQAVFQELQFDPAKTTPVAALKDYLAKLEKVEFVQESGVLGVARRILGKAEETSFGPSKTGSLARGVYAGLYNELHRMIEALEKNPKKWEKMLPELSVLLAKTKWLLSTAPQARQALVLLKMHDFVKKCRHHLESQERETGATLDFKKVMKYLGALNLNHLTRVTPRSLETRLSSVVGSLLVDFPDLDKWKKASKVSKSFYDLVHELRMDIAALAK